jgi:hypothetical protein
LDEAIARWTNEENDVEWTDNMRGYLTSLVYSVDAGADPIRDVDCRETTCRVVCDLARMASLQKGQAALESDGFAFLFRMDEGLPSTVTVFVTADPTRNGGP